VVLLEVPGASCRNPTSAIVDAGAEGLTPRLAAKGRYTVTLSQCTAAGEVEIAARTATAVGYVRAHWPGHHWTD
jgi:hypothetical protein